MSDPDHDMVDDGRKLNEPDYKRAEGVARSHNLSPFQIVKRELGYMIEDDRIPRYGRYCVDCEHFVWVNWPLENHARPGCTLIGIAWDAYAMIRTKSTCSAWSAKKQATVMVEGELWQSSLQR